MLLPAPGIEGTALAPNFRVADFRFETLDENSSTSSDAAPDTSSSKSRPGLVKRSVKRIGEDQKRLYLAPFELHNLKWDALVLVGTGAFLAADRRIENNIPHSHFTLYQATSDIALAGLAGSLGAIYAYGFKNEHRHARETGEIELETLVNTFLIYTPMQLILGRQRPDEGNGHGNFFKHHAVNTAFPGGRSAVPNLGVTCPTLLPVRSTAALRVRHTLWPTRPTDASLRGLASPGETDS